MSDLDLLHGVRGFLTRELSREARAFDPRYESLKDLIRQVDEGIAKAERPKRAEPSTLSQFPDATTAYPEPAVNAYADLTADHKAMKQALEHLSEFTRFDPGYPYSYDADTACKIMNEMRYTARAALAKLKVKP